MIYWMEHAPNPWVRVIAIVIVGGIAYFNRDDATVPQREWLGDYGVCSGDGSDPYDHWY